MSSFRKYTAIVTTTLVSPEGKVLGTKSEDLVLEVDMQEFPEGDKAADRHMKSELSTLLSAGAYNIKDCFK